MSGSRFIPRLELTPADVGNLATYIILLEQGIKPSQAMTAYIETLFSEMELFLAATTPKDWLPRPLATSKARMESVGKQL